MYYKKIWIIILIIVIMGGLFPSILIASAEDGEYPPDDIPDLEFSLQDAPFPGTYEKLTEGRWQAFIDRAESLGHNTIFQLTSYTVHYMDGGAKNFSIGDDPIYGPIFFSADSNAGGVGVVSEIIDKRATEDESYEFLAHFKYLPDTFPEMHEEYNVINKNGHNSYVAGTRNNWYLHQFHEKLTRRNSGSRYKEENMPVTINYHFVPWYSGEISNDPYQNKPERYNIDPLRGWGMSFLKPVFGDWINIPHKLGTYRDTIEIEIQMPQTYEASDGTTYKIYDVSEGIGQMAIPNFGIKLTSHNVKKIEGSQVVGRNGIWILPNQIKFIEGYMDGSYMHSAKFIASVPIEHAKPIDGGHSLIVADLVLYDVIGQERFSVEITEARTWTKYLTYLGTVDSDGDGFDDRTGLPINQPKPGDSIKDDKPNKDDYPDDIFGTIAYYFDTFIWYIKQPFIFIGDLINSILNWITSTIDGWIDSFTSIFTTLFSFLPAEVILMLALGFATLMIITIIRAVRGS